MYARMAVRTLFVSEEYGFFDGRTFVANVGEIEDRRLYLASPNGLLGGIGMKLDRNRMMYFGSWDGNAITEAATTNIGDSTGITAATVTAATFGTGVNGLSGEYVFLYKDGGWTLNGNGVASLTTYGLTATGDPAKGDIIVVDYTAASGGWEAIGKDNDDLCKELNPDVETSHNVLGESTVTHSGYEPEVDVEPYYIDKGRKMYKRLLENAIEEKFGEGDLLGYFAEAMFETKNTETLKMTGYCYVRQAMYVPQSTGGDTTGFAIPVNIYPVGPRTKKKIVYDMATNEATITDIA